MKMKEDSRWADPEKAARRIMEHARAFEPIQDGRTINLCGQRLRHNAEIRSTKCARVCTVQPNRSVTIHLDYKIRAILI
ncbi:hypothetical protein ABIF33_004880 [Bradyrhizobium elkanii]